jgi:hypothetical protein
VGAALGQRRLAVGDYSWTSASNLPVGTWVCNFARDGDRKARPACYQVTGGGTT